MKMITLFITRPVMTSMIMISILFLGVIAFFKLPVTDLPDVDPPVINVSANYLGASPEVMAKIVAAPIEKELSNLSGVKHLLSQNTRGSSWITILFDLDQDIDASMKEVEKAIHRAEKDLPHDLDHRPILHRGNAKQESMIYLVLTSPINSLSELYDAARQRIEPAIARIHGVGAVQLLGSSYAIHIQLNPELMAAKKITVDEVKRAIEHATGNLPLGTLETTSRKYTLELNHSFTSAKDFGTLNITPHVRIKDIAELFDGFASDQIYRFVTKEENQLAIVLGIQKRKGANLVQVSKEIHTLLPQLQSDLPPTAHLEIWFDKAAWIEEAILEMEGSFLLACVLVGLSVFLSFKKFRETAIAAISLPLSIIGTFICMYFLNFNIDILSLLALTLAMGFIIDDTIVVLENISRYMEKGLPPFKAAIIGTKEITFTVISMTLSLVAVFFPLLFMKNEIGKLFKEFSLTMAISILVSAFVSLAFIPMLCSKFLRSNQKPATHSNIFLFSFYQKSLNRCLIYKKSILSSALVLGTFALFSFFQLPLQLFPEEDRGFIWSFVQAPMGMSVKDTHLYQEKLCNIAQNHPDVESLISLNFKEFYCFLLRLNAVENRSSQSMIAANLQKQLNAIPGTFAYLQGMQLISPLTSTYARSKYQFILKGADFNEVLLASEELKKKMWKEKAFVNPNTNIKADSPLLQLRLLERAAAKFGLTRRSFQSLLQLVFSGGSVGKIEKSSEKYDVILELDPKFQNHIEAFSKLSHRTSDGSLIPLKALVDWKESIGFQNIEHLDALPAVTLYFDVPEKEDVANSLRLLKKIASETLPGTVSGKLEGIAQLIDSATVEILLLILFSTFAMYVVLGMLYESFIHPCTILSSLPFACLGGILTLLLFKEPLTIYSMVGFLLLIGIVKKNGIMMVDYALNIQKKEKLTAEEAIKEACLVRFRPIMMTTLAAIFGAIPIAVGIGSGSETRRGLGLVICGGLIFSQFLTLYITPILYIYTEKLKNWNYEKRRV